VVVGTLDFPREKLEMKTNDHKSFVVVKVWSLILVIVVVYLGYPRFAGLKHSGATGRCDHHHRANSNDLRSAKSIYAAISATDGQSIYSQLVDTIYYYEARLARSAEYSTSTIPPQNQFCVTY
jgi:hypothetical protein